MGKTTTTIPLLAHRIHSAHLLDAMKWVIFRCCFSSTPYEVNTTSDFRLWIDLRDPVGSTIYQNKTFEPVLTSWFHKLCNRGMVVADVGANIGYFSLLASRLIGDTGHVYAFEPIPQNARLFLKSIELNHWNKLVTLCPAAASDHSGSVDLRTRRGMPSGEATSQKLCGIHSSQWVQATVKVPAVTLDNYFDQLGVERIDLVKMDIEGGEVAALKGMAQGLKRKRYKTLMVEEHAMHDSSAPTEVRRLLREAGYHLYRFSGEKCLVPDRPDWGGYVVAFSEPPPANFLAL